MQAFLASSACQRATGSVGRSVGLLSEILALSDPKRTYVTASPTKDVGPCMPHLVAAGDGVAPHPGGGRPAEAPDGAGAEHVGLRGPPDGHVALRAGLPGRRPELRAGARGVVGAAAVVPLGPHRRVLQERKQSLALSTRLLFHSIAGRPHDKMQRKTEQAADDS